MMKLIFTVTVDRMFTLKPFLFERELNRIQGDENKEAIRAHVV